MLPVTGVCNYLDKERSAKHLLPFASMLRRITILAVVTTGGDLHNPSFVWSVSLRVEFTGADTSDCHLKNFLQAGLGPEQVKNPRPLRKRKWLNSMQSDESIDEVTSPIWTRLSNCFQNSVLTTDITWHCLRRD